MERNVFIDKDLCFGIYVCGFFVFICDCGWWVLIMVGEGSWSVFIFVFFMCVDIWIKIFLKKLNFLLFLFRFLEI